jgi:hypothetical protein
MDTKEIIQTVKYRYDQRLHKNLLEERYKNKLLVINQTGYWFASQQLISFLSIEALGEQVYIQDEYKNIILVNRQELLSVLIETYRTAMKQWAIELEELKQVR